MEVLRRFSDRVEVAGLDEAYLDLSGSPGAEGARPPAEARGPRRDAAGLLGRAWRPNKLLAKIASDLDKPDGFCVLEPEGMLEAVGERPATLIPGVGPRTAERLAQLGVRTVAELAARRAPRRWSGAFGPRLGPRASRPRPGPRRPAGGDRARAEVGEPRDDLPRGRLRPGDPRDTLDRLADSVCRGLAEGGYAGRTVTLKIRLRPFRTHTRSRTIDEPTRDPERVRSRGPSSCSAGSSSTPRCGCWGSASAAWCAVAGEHRSADADRTDPPTQAALV